MPHILMGDRSGIQAGQSSICTILLQSYTVVKHSECGLALGMGKKKNLFPPQFIIGEEAQHAVCIVFAVQQKQKRLSSLFHI